MKSNTPAHSEFWLDSFDIENDVEGSNTIDTKNLIKLSMARRAVSNFVNILTGKTIPVMFNANDANMTDGQNIYLSADIVENRDFDPAVGLALHEGSHILLTDFRLFQDIWQNVPRSLYNIAEPKGYSKSEVANYVQRMFNYVEDRYIDNFVYTSAPGYRPYYLSLYNKYFYSEQISVMLKSEMFRQPTLDAYDARIINLSNKATDLDALPGLRLIAEVLDLTNIDRLKTTQDRLDIALKIASIIYSNVVDYDTSIGQGQPQPAGAGLGSPDTTQSGQESGVETDGEEESDDVDDILGGGNASVDKPKPETNDEVKKNKETIDDNNSGLSKTKKASIYRAVERQKTFISGQIRKKKVSQKDKNTLDKIEKAGITVVDVGRTIEDGKPPTKGVECILVKNVTKEILLSDVFPCKRLDNTPIGIDSVNNGIRLGVLLGRKLKIRNEVNCTKHMRKSSGKIDRRILADLGADNENVFYKLDVDKYKTAKLHISIDASSSMEGEKWTKAITTVTAICKAASMVNNLQVTVSIRATTQSGSKSWPFIAIVYDSKKDPFIKVRNIFPYLYPNGSTPEGLCYEAIMDHLGESSSDEEHYFLNFSDGQPAYGFSSDKYSFTYDYITGGQHTLKQVNMIRNKGYKVLAYYICENNHRKIMVNSNEERCFKVMYGTDAKFIDVSNITGVANTLNQMFLSKT